ncbi:hypothetical protein TcWFU_007216 [Taenia crassiceps]|uniref:Uncharacterized protein n=1 Tax=Taenia crassiceps TaxID=6207 RepID=A0ABR4Q0J6_9CEST
MNTPVHVQLRSPDSNQFYASGFGQDFLSLPPPIPPHRTPERSTDQVFLRPENRPLLPPSASITPFTCYPEELQKPLPRPPRTSRRRLGGPSNGFNSAVALPTPKPRNHHADCRENNRKEQGNRTPYRASGYPLRLAESVRGRFTSSDHLEGALAMTMPHRETRSLQQYRSMTTLNYTTAESPSMHDSLMAVGNDPWLPIADGKSQLLSVDMMTSEIPD